VRPALTGHNGSTSHPLHRPSDTSSGHPRRYTETDLGTGTVVADLNERTGVTGAHGPHAFIWTDGTMTDLRTFGGPNSAAYGINDRGQVVGSAMTAANQWHAFLWTNGTMTDLGRWLRPPDSISIRQYRSAI